MTVRGGWVGVILALLASVGLTLWFLNHSRFMDIDRCLDSGGAWSAGEERCIGQGS